MLARLFLLFSIVSLVELYLLVWLATLTGFWPTLGLVVFTALLGATLAKREGLKVLREWQEALAKMQAPKEGLTGALLVLVAGVFLMTPGVLTDITGILLLIAPIRRWVARRIEARFFPAGLGAAAGFGGQTASPFGDAFRSVRGSAGRVSVGGFRVEVGGGRATATRVEVVDHGPDPSRDGTSRDSAQPAALEAEILDGDVVVDRRGRIVHRKP